MDIYVPGSMALRKAAKGPDLAPAKVGALYIVAASCWAPLSLLLWKWLSENILTSICVPSIPLLLLLPEHGCVVGGLHSVPFRLSYLFCWLTLIALLGFGLWYRLHPARASRARACFRLLAWFPFWCIPLGSVVVTLLLIAIEAFFRSHMEYLGTSPWLGQ